MTTDDCGACERFAVTTWDRVTIDGVPFPGTLREAGRALRRLGAQVATEAIERTRTVARKRAGKARRTDGRK